MNPVRAMAIALAAFFGGLGVLGAGAPAHASLYIVRNVVVDKSAANASEARDLAVSEAQTQAAQRMIARLTLPEDRAPLGAIDPATANLLVSGYEVQEERVSGQRYLGVFTVAFDANQVRGFLNSRKVTYVEARTRPVVVLPLMIDDAGARLWEDNAWLQAWRSGDTAGALAPLIVPTGDLDDLAAVTAEQAQALAFGPLKAIADRYGAERVIVTAARPLADTSDASAPAGVAAFARLIDFTGEGNVQSLSSVSGPMPDAISGLSEQIQTAWKERAVVRDTGVREFALDVRFSDARGWRTVQSGLGGASLVVSAQLNALAAQGALMSVRYRGTPDQLATELAERGVSLRQDPSGGWLAEPMPGA